MRPLLSTIFPQGFQISKNIGHPTSGSGDKKTVERYLKSEQTHRQTDRRTHRRTDRRTFRLIESIGPEGRCFEKLWKQKNIFSRFLELLGPKIEKLAFSFLILNSWKYFLHIYKFTDYNEVWFSRSTFQEKANKKFTGCSMSRELIWHAKHVLKVLFKYCFRHFQKSKNIARIISNSVTIWRNVSVAFFFAPNKWTYLWSQILIYQPAPPIH